MFFFFKQKTAYEMRISDWSSDVCSSDLLAGENRRARNTVPCCCDGSVLCERFSGSVAMDQLDRVRLLAPLRDLHARRTKRHPWEDQAACVRLFFEERSEEHTSELQSLMRISYAVFCLKKKNNRQSAPK